MFQKVSFKFPAASPAEQSRLAVSLQDAFRQVPGMETSLAREREDAQDTGTILTVLLSAPAVVIAVKSLGAWLNRNNQSEVMIERSDGTVIMRNMKSQDVPKAIEALKNEFGRS